MGYVKQRDPFFNPKNGYEESIVHLFESKNCHVKRYDLILIIKRIIRNGIFGISVGAYCIRPLKIYPKGTYDQKFRYMWSVFNTPLPWRTKRSISKINFGVIRNGMTLFLIWKMFMQNRLSIYLNQKMVMRNGTIIFLIRKIVM